jgi:hypothetical protein
MSFRKPIAQPAGKVVTPQVVANNARALDDVATKIDALPFSSGREITAETDGASLTIAHGLGRKYRGFLVLNGANVVENENNNERDKLLKLTVSSNAGVELIDRYTFASNLTNATVFSGLDGDTDDVWTYRANIVMNSAAQTWLWWEPNGTATGGMGHQHYSNGTATHGIITVNQFPMFRSEGLISATNTIVAEGTIFAASGRFRHIMSRFVDINTDNSAANVFFGYTGGIWRDSSTNITSLELVAATANFFGIGSWVELYRNVSASVPRVVKLWVF